MPWEKSFDVSDAVDSAKDVFWKKGYSAASIADLLSAMRLKRGSLYNAFGGKQELFVKALLKYDRENRRKFFARFENSEKPREAIKELFAATVDDAARDFEKKGCFLVNTALELPTHSKEVQEIVRAGLGDIESFFQRMIKIGQARHEISDEIDAAQTATTLLGLMVSIRVLSRGAFDTVELEAIADSADRLMS